MPKPFPARGVNTTFSPKKRRSLRRSIEKLSAIVTTRGYPFGAHTMRQTDPRITARGFDDCLTRFQIATALCFFKNTDRPAVIHRSGRIKKFRLHIEAYMVRGQIVNSDKRGVADRIDHTVKRSAAAAGCSRISDVILFLLSLVLDD